MAGLLEVLYVNSNFDMETPHSFAWQIHLMKLVMTQMSNAYDG